MNEAAGGGSPAFFSCLYSVHVTRTHYPGSLFELQPTFSLEYEMVLLKAHQAGCMTDALQTHFPSKG